MRNIVPMNNRCNPGLNSPKKYLYITLLVVMLSLGSLSSYDHSNTVQTHVIVQVELQKRRRRFARRFQHKYLLIV